MPHPSREFDFAISFASGQRRVAAELADALAEQGYQVFYDGNSRSRLLGKRLDKEFARCFGEGTHFFVPIVSADYAERGWPQLEWAIAQRESGKRRDEFILPLRVDDTILLGLPDSVGYVDLREVSIREVVGILAGKLPRSYRSQVMPSTPHCWVATFGLVVSDVTTSGLLPSGIPASYPNLCDWLEEDLIRKLRAAPVQQPEIAEPSARDGEILSVRIAFQWNPELSPLTFGGLNWWEVLEVLPYDDVY